MFLFPSIGILGIFISFPPLEFWGFHFLLVMYANWKTVGGYPSSSQREEGTKCGHMDGNYQCLIQTLASLG